MPKKRKKIQLVETSIGIPVTETGKPIIKKKTRKDIQDIFFEDEKRGLEVQQKRLFRSRKLENRIKDRAKILLVRKQLDSMVIDKRTGQKMTIRNILKRKIIEERIKQDNIRNEIRILENDIRQFKEILKREKKTKFKKKLQELGLIPTKRSEDE